MTILNDILDFSKVEENKLELEIARSILIKSFIQLEVQSNLWPMKKYPLIVENEIPGKCRNSLVIARDFAKSCSTKVETRPNSPTM
ncbi:hypothetical protein O9929_23485 [Vibrio lentus]|nr:hypothetical protein [Vibrio lentus]